MIIGGAGMAIYSKVTRHGQIILPASIRKQLGVNEDDLIEIAIIDDKAVLMPKKLIDSSQTYFWKKEWQNAEKEASRNIQEGKVQSFQSAEELFEEIG
jgi:AbrB family looped-hinge helix DNA binding protein